MIVSRTTILFETLPVSSALNDSTEVSTDSAGGNETEFSEVIRIFCPELVIVIDSSGFSSPYISRSSEYGWYNLSLFASGELAGITAVTESVVSGSSSSTILLISSSSSS